MKPFSQAKVNYDDVGILFLKNWVSGIYFWVKLLRKIIQDNSNKFPLELLMDIHARKYSKIKFKNFRGQWRILRVGGIEKDWKHDIFSKVLDIGAKKILKAQQLEEF